MVEGYRLARRKTAVLLVAGSLSVGAVGVPMTATPPFETRKERAAAALIAANLRSQSSQVMASSRGAVRSLIVAPRRHGLINDRVREEFFRAEIPFGGLIYEHAVRNNLAPELVAAVVSTESDFRPTLQSNKNAIGLMQVLPSTGHLMGVSNLLDPEENVKAGTRYLKYLTRRFKGDQKMILAAYNAGEGNVAKFGGVPPFRETQNYLERVSRRQNRYVTDLAMKISQSE